MENFVEKDLKTINPRLWLSGEYTKRRSRNPNYSLRSFSSLLKLDASTVSQILSGKRQISAKIILHLTEILEVDPTTKNALIKFANKKVKSNQVEAENSDDIFRQLTLDTCALISDWYHYAILELTFVKDVKNDLRWIAKTIGITAAEANIAIDRLKRLGLLKEDNKKLVKTENFITNFKDGVTSKALKDLQRSILTMALDAIDNTPQEEKDITSMTFAIDEKKIPEAREKIKKFRREMSQFLESGTQTRVYHLGIQLYPIKNKKREN